MKSILALALAAGLAPTAFATPTGYGMSDTETVTACVCVLAPCVVSVTGTMCFGDFTYNPATGACVSIDCKGIVQGDPGKASPYPGSMTTIPCLKLCKDPSACVCVTMSQDFGKSGVSLKLDDAVWKAINQYSQSNCPSLTQPLYGCLTLPTGLTGSTISGCVTIAECYS